MMSTQPILQPIEQHDPNAAVLSEILAINSALSDLQGRVSRLAHQMATKKVVVPFEAYAEGVLKAVADAIGEQEPEGWNEAQMGPWSPLAQTRAEERGVWPVKVDNMDGGSDTLDAAAAIMEAPLEPATEGSEVEPYTPIPFKHYVPASPACQKVLNLYGETTITSADIARQLDMNRSSVGSYLAMGRKANDPRVLKGDAARRSEAVTQLTEEDDPDFAEVVETVVVVVDEPSEPSALESQSIPAGLSSVRVFRRPLKEADEDEGLARLRIPSVPAAPRKFMPVDPSIEKPQPKPVAAFDADKIMVVDVEASKIHGPLGTIDVARPFARSLERMTDGGTYDVDTLRDLGPWPRIDALKDHFSTMRRKLAAIGIDLVSVNKFMFRVQRLEA
jgi:hypothetical protein